MRLNKQSKQNSDFFINSAFKVLLALFLLLILSILTLSHISLPSRTSSHVWVQLLSVLFFNLSVFTFLLTRCARVPLPWIQNLPRLIPLYHHPGLPLFLSFIQPITPALSTLLLLPSISAPSRFPHLQSPSSVISQQEKIYFVLQPVFFFYSFILSLSICFPVSASCSTSAECCCLFLLFLLPAFSVSYSLYCQYSLNHVSLLCWSGSFWVTSGMNMVCVSA